MNVINTSVNRTGISADINKIKVIYDNNIDNSPISIASGINIDNVSDYLPYVDIFLVSTGISLTDDEFDKDKVIKLSNLIHFFLKIVIIGLCFFY